MAGLLDLPQKQKLPPARDFKISLMKPVIKPTRPHQHAGYHEVIFLTDGAGTHQIEDEVHEVAPGSIFFLTPGQVHCWDFTRIPRGYVLMFRAEWLQAAFTGLPPAWPALYTVPAHLTLSPGDRWQRLDRLMCNLMDLEPAGPGHMQAAYLYLILEELGQARTQPGAPARPGDLASLERFRRLVEQAFRTERELDHYAGQLGLSPRKLNALCQRLSGRSARDLIRERILLEAKRLLTHSDATISEIAYELGFHDPSHFVKFFKQLTQLTPGAFRSRLA